MFCVVLSIACNFPLQDFIDDLMNAAVLGAEVIIVSLCTSTVHKYENITNTYERVYSYLYLYMYSYTHIIRLNMLVLIVMDDVLRTTIVTVPRGQRPAPHWLEFGARVLGARHSRPASTALAHQSGACGFA